MHKRDFRDVSHHSPLLSSKPPPWVTNTLAATAASSSSSATSVASSVRSPATSPKGSSSTRKALSTQRGGGTGTGTAGAGAGGDVEAVQTGTKDGRMGAYVLGGDGSDGSTVSPQKRRQLQLLQQKEQQEEQIMEIREEQRQRKLEEQRQHVGESELCRDRMSEVLAKHQSIFDDATTTDPLTYRGPVRARVQKCIGLHVHNGIEYIDQRESYLEELGRARKAVSGWSRRLQEQGEQWLVEVVDGVEEYYEGLVESLLLDIEEVDAKTMAHVFEARAELTMDWTPRTARSGSRAFGGGLVAASESPLARARAHASPSAAAASSIQPPRPPPPPPPSYEESHDHTPSSSSTSTYPAVTPAPSSRAPSSPGSPGSPGSLGSPGARSRGTPGTFDVLGLAKREMEYVTKEAALDLDDETDPRYVNAVSRIIGDVRDESAVTVGTWMARYCARIGENRADTLDCISYILTGKGGCPVGSRIVGVGVAHGREDMSEALNMSMQSQMSGMTELDEDAGEVVR